MSSAATVFSLVRLRERGRLNLATRNLSVKDQRGAENGSRPWHWRNFERLLVSMGRLWELMAMATTKVYNQSSAHRANFSTPTKAAQNALSLQDRVPVHSVVPLKKDTPNIQATLNLSCFYHFHSRSSTARSSKLLTAEEDCGFEDLVLCVEAFVQVSGNTLH